ncbi:hypothetical protein D0Z00_002773 [Geotrichum galactomycetum]|uniref:Uncharacterized protein n=1 Tax=Geotrichum galactomycetum TaxID=27317 RepID=A0ACB6V3D4_9ASCO|nr:hypothetical protein D0Z00_002773 [Geotrichum candidum]
MGANSSKLNDLPQSTRYVSEKRRVKVAAVSDGELVDQLSKYLTLGTAATSYGASCEISGLSNPLTAANIQSWEEKLLSDPKNRLAQSAITAGNLTDIVKVRNAIVEDNIHVFSDVVEFEGAPITNQRSSGRCWLFASTNIFRIAVQQKYGIPNFELSQAYLFFYDKLEKSNYFLQNIIETADLELDSKLVQTLLADPVSDGGQWDMVVNLVEKYGLIPQTLFPDSFNAQNSAKLDYIVVNKLREYALLLRKAAAASSSSDAAQGETLRVLTTLKEKFVQEIFNILVITLGSPPKADEAFTWEFFDGEGKAHTVTTTPLDFYKSVVKFDAPEHFSLIHDPRNAYNKLYTVDRLNNLVGGKKIEYVNVDIEVLKEAAIAAIKNNEPVFFGSDVGKFSETASGIMDVKAWDYELAFNTSLGLNKADRVRVGSSAMTHAMVLTGVHLVDGKPVKWKVMNSWGAAVGDKGYMTMSDAWFDEYVYQVVTTGAYVAKEVTAVWKAKDFVVLPRWDPYGSLA